MQKLLFREAKKKGKVYFGFNKTSSIFLNLHLTAHPLTKSEAHKRPGRGIIKIF